ncbi:MAG: hypothetical protein LBI58_02505 [Tannerellaceae bacterium]|jgi:hypothetical protein|nr:hypothetical protein [Tannerellaceae bacterium]
MRIFLVLIITTLYIMPSYGQRGDWYNDEGGYTFEGAGTQDDPYLITSVEGLTFMAEQVNIWPGKSFQGEYFRLMEDIDLVRHFWIPVGSESHQPFRGVFDGNGKTISNLYIGSMEVDNVYAAAGFFGHLGNGARIENLTISGGAIIGGGREAVSRTGCIAGYLLCSVSEAKDSIVIRNCHIKDMKVTGANTEVANTGGLIGESYSFSDGNGGAMVLMEDCSYSGVVVALSSDYPYTGGIVGKGRGHGYCNGDTMSSGTFVLRSCTNRGDITGGSTSGSETTSSTGGIIGFGYGSGDGDGASGGSGSIIIEYCINSGTITGGDVAGAQAFSYTGGLAGYGDGYGYGDLTRDTSAGGYGYGAFMIRSSVNRGAVKGGYASDTTAVLSTGGILGFGSGSASGDKAGKGTLYGSFSMRNCYSYAPIMAKKGFLGGLTGWLATIGQGTNHTVSAIIRDSYAAGTINRGDSVHNVITGGIAGRMQKSKEASRGPQIGNCLVALSYINGHAEQTFRIVGQMQGILQPFNRILSRNYAYVKDGEWIKATTLKNGHNWNRQMLRAPISFWNIKDKAWIVREDGYKVMPLLDAVSGQDRVPVP